MTIKTIAIIPQQSGIKVSKSKVVEIDKGKTFKFDGAYVNAGSFQQIYADHFTSATLSAANGLNESFMQFSNGSDEGDVFRTTNTRVGLLEIIMKEMFQKLQPKDGNPQNLVSVSMVQVTKSGELKDMGNPHDRPLSVKLHSSQGIYIHGLSQIVCGVYQDVVRLYEDGCQASNTLKLSPQFSLLTVRINSKPGGNPGKGTLSTFQFANYSSEQRSMDSVQEFLSSIAQKKGKVSEKLVTRSHATQLMFDVMLENKNCHVITSVDGADLKLAGKILSLNEPLSGVGSTTKVNPDNSSIVMQQLRQEIGSVRDRLAQLPPPHNKQELARMEKLMEDLEETKMLDWDQILWKSDKFLEERRSNFAHKGLLWILEAVRPATKENVQKLQSLKEKLIKECKQQQLVTNQVTSELKDLIDSYTQQIKSGKNSESESKAKVAAIQQMKDHFKVENEKFKDLKGKLINVKEQLQLEIQNGVEQSSNNFDSAFHSMQDEREKMREENAQLVEDELAKMKIEVDRASSELDMQVSSKSLVTSEQKVLDNEKELVKLRAEKSVMTAQLEVFKRESAQMEDHMRILLEKHNKQMSIQQLQNMQTFRAYRQVHEDFKVELENRWRSLLDEAIQDAVFLSARNTELKERNGQLQQELGKMKDDRSLKKGAKAIGL